jgi:hypothetical protein
VEVLVEGDQDGAAFHGMRGNPEVVVDLGKTGDILVEASGFLFRPAAAQGGKFGTPLRIRLE